MFHRIFYTILMILISGNSSALAECKTVRLDERGGPFEKIPVYDQTKYSTADQNICYAVAGAQLLDADRFYSGDHELKQLSSPLSVALNFKMKTGDVAPYQGNDPSRLAANLLGGGEIAPALNASFDQPLCDQRSLEKYSSLIGTKERNPLPRKYFRSLAVGSTDNFLKAILDQVQRSTEFQQNLNLVIRVEAPPECELNMFFRSRALSRENLNDIQRSIHEALKQDSFLTQANTAFRELCQKDSFTVAKKKVESFNGAPEYNKETTDNCYRRALEVLEKMPHKTASDYVRETDKCTVVKISPEKLQAKAQSLLEGPNPVPVGISYNPGALKKSDNPGSHASVIIGQQFNQKTKSCEFLVRDSYGPTCNETKSDYKYPCENGSVWVPEKVLFSATKQLTWIPR